MPTCPMCAEDVAAADTVCPHCGNVLRAAVQVFSATPAVQSSRRPQTLAEPPKTTRRESSREVGRGAQWIVPGVLAVALSLVVVAKFAWWDRQWQGSSDACEAAIALAGSHPSSEGRDEILRDYFGGSERAFSNFGLELASAISQLQVSGRLRTHGILVPRLEQLYLAALRDAGVPESAARVNFRAHRDEILGSVGRTVIRGLTLAQQADLQGAAAACRSSVALSPNAASEPRHVERVSAPAPPVAPPTPEVAPPTPAPAPTAIAPPVAAALPAEPALERLVPATMTASSFISNGRDQYAPFRAFDGDPATTWTEAARGPGDGQWIQAAFAVPRRVRRVSLSTGWDHTSARGEDLFSANSHLRRVRLRLAPGVVEERDVGEAEREVVFDDLDVTTDTVRIEAVRVWPGARWADLCIGEVTIEGTAPTVAESGSPAPVPRATGRQRPPPCFANCIRTHRAAYVRCADACVRRGDRGAECNQECGRDYDRCLNDECHLTGDDTPWFRPDVSVPVEGADAGTLLPSAYVEVSQPAFAPTR